MYSNQKSPPPCDECTRFKQEVSAVAHRTWILCLPGCGDRVGVCWRQLGEKGGRVQGLYWGGRGGIPSPSTPAVTRFGYFPLWLLPVMATSRYGYFPLWLLRRLSDKAPMMHSETKIDKAIRHFNKDNPEWCWYGLHPSQTSGQDVHTDKGSCTRRADYFGRIVGTDYSRNY